MRFLSEISIFMCDLMKLNILNILLRIFQNGKYYSGSTDDSAPTLAQNGPMKSTDFLFLFGSPKRITNIKKSNFWTIFSKVFKMECLRRSSDQNKRYLQYFLDCFMTGTFCDLKIQTSFSSYILCHRMVLASVFPDLQYLLAQVKLDVKYFTFADLKGQMCIFNADKSDTKYYWKQSFLADANLNLIKIIFNQF